MKKFFIKIKSVVDLIFLFLMRSIFKNTDYLNRAILINTGQIGDLIVSSKLIENDYLFEEFDEVFFLLRKEYSIIFDIYDGPIQFFEINVDSYRYNYFYRIYINFILFQKKFNTVFNLTSIRPTWNDSLALGISAKNTYCFTNRWESLIKTYTKTIENMYSVHFDKDIFNEYDKIDLLINYLGAKEEKFQIKKRIFLEEIHENIVYDLIIAPFTSEIARNWPIKNFEKIIAAFKNEYKILIVSDSDQLNNFKHLDVNENIFFSKDRYQLNKLFAVIKRARIFIGLDSGITHIALKTGIKVIAIIGGGNFKRYLPVPHDKKNIYLYNKVDCFGCEWYCTRTQMDCLVDVKTDNVINMVKNELLN